MEILRQKLFKKLRKNQQLVLMLICFIFCVIMLNCGYFKAEDREKTDFLFA